VFERHTPNGEVQYRDVVIGEDRSADKTMTPARSFTTPRLLSREKTRRARVLGLVLRETGGGEATLEPEAGVLFERLERFFDSRCRQPMPREPPVMSATFSRNLDR